MKNGGNIINCTRGVQLKNESSIVESKYVKAPWHQAFTFKKTLWYMGCTILKEGDIYV